MKEITVLPIRLKYPKADPKQNDISLHLLVEALSHQHYSAGLAHIKGSSGEEVMEIKGIYLISFIGHHFNEIQTLLEYHGFLIDSNFLEEIFQMIKEVKKHKSLRVPDMMAEAAETYRYRQTRRKKVSKKL